MRTPILHNTNSETNDPNGSHYLFEPLVDYDSPSGRYTMWFTSGTSLYGSTFCVSPARSTDGVTWSMFLNNPVLESGAAGAWDSKDIGWCGEASCHPA